MRILSAIGSWFVDPPIPIDPDERLLIRRGPGSLWRGSSGSDGMVVLTDRRLRFRRQHAPIDWLQLHRAPKIVDVNLADILEVSRGRKREGILGGLPGFAPLKLKLKNGETWLLQCVVIDKWESELRELVQP